MPEPRETHAAGVDRRNAPRGASAREALARLLEQHPAYSTGNDQQDWFKALEAADAILDAGWMSAGADECPGVLHRVLAAAEPRNLMAWEAKHGLTVASVSRYITAALAPGHPALPPAALAPSDPATDPGGEGRAT